MYTTLLFKESPFLVIILLGLLSITQNKPYVFGMIIIICIYVVYFYRYSEYTKLHADNEIISPANGRIIFIRQYGDLVQMSIYLNLLNNHTQIYPANGLVVKRIYDLTGKFELLNNIYKSRFNEKKIHIMEMNNGNYLKLIQIAGYFPRRIVSSDLFPENVIAGQYLGIIKFGSRVDLEFPGDISNLLVKKNQMLNIGDPIYNY